MRSALQVRYDIPVSPRGRRRWCSMSSRGNRAKVPAHARRCREGGAPD
ncbi:CGNR zinc finger domain-containing protein [Streptomyces qinglanensis]